ncbi:hypothetical protein MSG28_000072 [Choristoneura fumiferana]|uniref:Uncharacterized protein n=1 Tax=Choristoneura fumiferana TaxID=7141 RepID=A0ACC0JYV4_CHOFU|nr:hypothetical protein MSG28_000072 [Choristoneura fumiferana]
MSLLVENGDRGQYLMYVPLQGVPEGKKLDPVDVRFKQTGDNEVLGMMLCESQEVYAMARISKVPRKAHLQDAAARLNYRCRGGKSYLYAGHNWMPIPEQDERTFWSPLRQTRYMQLDVDDRDLLPRPATATDERDRVAHVTKDSRFNSRAQRGCRALTPERSEGFKMGVLRSDGVDFSGSRLLTMRKASNLMDYGVQ